MYKIYFKQAVQILKQNKFISVIAILGTAFAIMMIMVIIISDEVRNVSVAPEINRHSTYYIPYEMRSDTTSGSMWGGSMTIDLFNKYLKNMQTPDEMSIITSYDRNSRSLINALGSNDLHLATIRATDGGYWNILSFTFLEGSPFSKEASESGVKEAVIVESLAKKLFRGESAVGKFILLNQIEYRITGIVKDVSAIFQMGYSEIWIPYSSQSGYDHESALLLILLKNKENYPALYKEVREAENQYHLLHEPWTQYFAGPEKHTHYVLGVQGATEESVKEQTKVITYRKLFIFFILLIIPALNLSGLSLSRIKKRTEEIGLRKAFGAKRHIILIQVLYENLITSLIGGILGLLFSYFVIYQMRSWLLGIPGDETIPVSTLISFPVFIGVFIACVLINLLSAGIPAYKASKMNIIQSLTQNTKTT